MTEVMIEQSKALFIRRWGEMAASWGISRTMAEIHALLFVSTRPLCTDDVMGRLQVSRGSASMNLRELTRWGLIERMHVRGDRKEYFKAESDVWQMFETISHERRRREVEPIIETINRCMEMIDSNLQQLTGKERDETLEYRRRIDAMLEFLDVVNAIFNLVLTSGKGGFQEIAKLLGKFSASAS
ncbi:MAG: transcriptional regulator [Phycisphaerae bacterium]|nr:transcriptional regulator [Phycisphaerae bacterium]